MKDRAKKLNPVVELEKRRFEDQLSSLNEIRKKKLEIVAYMKETQREYMEGVDRLNKQRGCPNRQMLESMEKGLDGVKDRWIELYKQCVAAEREEKIQLDQLLTIHKKLEATKNLQEKFRRLFNDALRRREQKILDETAIRKFISEAKSI